MTLAFKLYIILAAIGKMICIFVGTAAFTILLLIVAYLLFAAFVEYVL
jgi:hypothetical protein